MRPIDADAMKDTNNNVIAIIDPETKSKYWISLNDYINAQPTVDTIKHAHWVRVARSENLEQTKWILCSKRMPEEHEWIGTKEFGTTISDEVYVTFENPEGKRFVKHLRFQNGKLSGFDQSKIDAFYKGSLPIAWMPLPEPYNAETEGKND